MFSFFVELRNILVVILWFYIGVLLIRLVELSVGHTFVLIYPARKEVYIKQFRLNKRVNLL